METRKEELFQLQTQIAEIDAEFSKILQHLQWDRKHLLEDMPKVNCKYNVNHRISQKSKESHEVLCRLSHNSYSNEDKMLPDPLDKNAKTVIRLNNDDIKQIITQAANADPSFKKVFNKSYLLQNSNLLILENVDIEPQTLDRLQSTYTGDERRAIYDVVVQAAPFCHDLSDLALPSEQGQEDSNIKQKSRLEILAELRDMKRRRTKYRVAAKTRNYSDVLRDVIKTQMEVYSDVKIEMSGASISNEKKWKDDVNLEINKPHRPSRNDSLKSTSEYNDNTYKHKREMSRSSPSTSKKTRRYDETDSCSEHKNYKDKRYYEDVKRERCYKDVKKERDRHSSRDSSRYDERFNSEKRKDRPKEHRNYKEYEDRSAKESKQYEKSHRREKHSSSRGQRDEQDESKRYSRYEYESRKDKKKYYEYK